MLWLTFAILVLFVIAILVFPMLEQKRVPTAQRVDYDVVVYRDQLREITNEVERGLLSETQAGPARAEIYRRMLAAEDADLKIAPTRINRRFQFAAIAIIIILVPAGAGTVYAFLGSPNLPGQPYAWRMEHDPQLASASAADKLKALLEANPNAAGYANLGAMYFAARNYKEASAAYRRAVNLGSTDVATWSALGESIVMSNDGAVIPEAMAAFTHALHLDPRSERSRFYMGLAEEQIGQLRKAVAIWRDLENTSDPNAPWMGLVREHITYFSKQGGFDPSSVRPSPPSADAMNAAISAMTTAIQSKREGQFDSSSSESASAQDTMIQAMVAKLAAKLRDNPSDPDGWKRLAVAYNVLGKTSEARNAIEHAVQLKPNNVDILLTLAKIQKAGAPESGDAPLPLVNTMRKVLKLDPSNTSALYYIGVYEQENGRPQQARAMWQKAVATMAQNDPLGADIRARLATLSQQEKVSK